MSALLALLFSQYLSQNWMQARHICRSELWQTQSGTASHLKSLLGLNPQVLSLRAALQEAKAELALGEATNNPLLVGRALRNISRIRVQQKVLQFQQISLISESNRLMTQGVLAVQSQIRRLDQENRERLPQFFVFEIREIRMDFHKLAVRPVGPDQPAIYEPRENFSSQQRLSVSWKTRLKIQLEGNFGWVHEHKKQESCAVSLTTHGQDFAAELIEVKSYSNL